MAADDRSVLVTVIARVSAWNRPLSFLLLVAAMLAIAVGHLYLLRGLTTVYVGVPLWLWVQLLVVAVLFGMAWIATELVSPIGRR